MTSKEISERCKASDLRKIIGDNFKVCTSRNELAKSQVDSIFVPSKPPQLYAESGHEIDISITSAVTGKAAICD